MSDWKVDPQMVDDYIEQDEAVEDVYVPFLNCGWKSSEDGCCSHPNNATPECHQFCCPISVAVEHRVHLTCGGLRLRGQFYPLPPPYAGNANR